MNAQRFLENGNHRMFAYEQLLWLEGAGKVKASDMRYLVRKLDFVAGAIVEYLEENDNVFCVVEFTRKFFLFLKEKRSFRFQFLYHSSITDLSQWGWYEEVWTKYDEDELDDYEEEEDDKLVNFIFGRR